MSCEVVVTEAVEAKIAGWRLPTDIEEEIYERLQRELGDHRDEFLRDIAAPVRLSQYSFSTRLSGRKVTFVFRIERSEGERLAVVDVFQLKQPVHIDSHSTLPTLDE